jgi:chemotaxis protein methyltransferase WspC
MNFQRLRTLLERHYGWATEAIHDRELQNAVQAQAHELSLDFKTQPERVLSILCQDPKLLAKLAEALAVHETWFFRGIAQLQHAVDYLAGRRIQIGLSSDGAPFKILSAPCSTGEEAYSLALLLSQRGFTSREVIIDGIDQSETAIDRARLGSYNHNSFRESLWNTPNTIAGIRPLGDRWHVESQIANMVQFHVGNLLEMFAPPGLYDCIFCRNLLIYLSQSKRLELLQRLAQWLTPQGRIYVSAVEAPIAHEAGLTAIAPLELQIFVPSQAKESSHFSESSQPASRFKRIPSTTHSAARTAFAHPVVQAEVAVVAPPKSHDAELDLVRAEQAADAGRFAEAEAILNGLPTNIKLTAAAQFLRGVVAQAQGKLDEAQFAWEQAVYLDPQHGPALQRLWLAATSRGDKRLAEQYRRRWLKRRVES